MPRTEYILDTSVVVKWSLEEENSDKAKDLLKRYEAKELKLFIPDLLLIELANVLYYSKCYEPDEIAKIVSSVRQNISVILLNDQIITSALHLSAEFKLPVYDTVFLATAIQLDNLLITADEKMYRKLDEKTATNIILLSKW